MRSVQSMFHGSPSCRTGGKRSTLAHVQHPTSKTRPSQLAECVPNMATAGFCRLKLDDRMRRDVKHVAGGSFPRVPHRKGNARGYRADWEHICLFNCAVLTAFWKFEQAFVQISIATRTVAVTLPTQRSINRRWRLFFFAMETSLALTLQKRLRIPLSQWGCCGFGMRIIWRSTLAMAWRANLKDGNSSA